MGSEYIVGGTSLFSKRGQLHHPALWPSQFQNSSGIKIITKDNQEFLDFSLMGVGTGVLGYNNKFINNAVISGISKGNYTTLDSWEEGELARKLVELHPWASKCRFARTGGEIAAQAIRSGRALTNKSHVVVCGYHGWHDWYLASNLERETLDQLLLSGVRTSGIPSELQGTTTAVNFNDQQGMIDVFQREKVGVLIMEVSRSEEPSVDFLKLARDLCNLHNVVLIFDECTSGFRESLGGIHPNYDVIPDVVLYGKALGGGFAITAAVFNQSTSEALEQTFTSSTFWSEKVGIDAGLAVFDYHEKYPDSFEKVIENGRKMRNIWQTKFADVGVEIISSGRDSIPSFRFAEEANHLLFKTYLTQVFLGRGILATTSFYSSIAHSSAHFEHYESILTDIVNDIALGSEFISRKIHGSLCTDSFKRLA